MNDYIKKGPTDCWLWQGNPKNAPHFDCRMACNNNQCCNPRHIVMHKKQDSSPHVETEKEAEKEVSEVSEEDAHYQPAAKRSPTSKGAK